MKVWGWFILTPPPDVHKINMIWGYPLQKSGQVNISQRSSMHSTDTHGYSEMVFAVSHLIGGSRRKSQKFPVDY